MWDTLSLIQEGSEGWCLGPGRQRGDPASLGHIANRTMYALGAKTRAAGENYRPHLLFQFHEDSAIASVVQSCPGY
jgi:hypothetical protein